MLDASKIIVIGESVVSMRLFINRYMYGSRNKVLNYFYQFNVSVRRIIFVVSYQIV